MCAVSQLVRYDEEIEKGQKYLQIWQRFTSLPMVSHHVKFAKAIENEAQKQDTKLIKTMLEVFETLADKLPENKSTTKTCYAINDLDRDCVHSMVNLLRKRLENT